MCLILLCTICIHRADNNERRRLSINGLTNLIHTISVYSAHTFAVYISLRHDLLSNYIRFETTQGVIIRTYKYETLVQTLDHSLYKRLNDADAS